MRFLSSVLVFALLAVPAAAQPWYARGGFNGWSTGNVDGSIPDYPMVVDPGDATHYTANFSGMFSNDPWEWKIATSDWSINMPSGNSKVYVDAAGEINFHLWDNTTWSDGWFPNAERRVGYNDHQQFDWEIVGSMNGWPAAADPNFALIDMGNGLHRGTFALNAGIYDFKFRGLTATSWENSIGNNFGNSAGNNTFAVGTNGDQWTFELDLPNGRWRTFTNAAPPAQVGDYNSNGLVDAADYTRWRDNLGAPAGTLPNDADGGVIGQAQYDTWKANFGQGSAYWVARSPQLPDQPMVDLGGGQYKLNLISLTPAADYEFKVTLSDLSASAPGSNMKVRADASGAIDLNFYELTAGSWGDGWSPANTHRVGYVDHQQFDWEIVGDFNAWPPVNDPLFSMTDQGNGLHTGAFTFSTPGTYGFKFRHQDATNPWNVSIGDDFGNSAANNSFTVVSASELWHFELDLPNGRWRAYLDGAGAAAGAAAGAVPEPASVLLALMGFAVGGVMIRRRG
jgi:hypothetical protein